MPILCGWSAHKVDPITKHLDLVCGDVRPRSQSTRAQSWKMFWAMLSCLQRSHLQNPAGTESSFWDTNKSGGICPFWVYFFCGWNEGGLCLLQSDSSGNYFAWKAMAMGKNCVNGKTFLEKIKRKFRTCKCLFSCHLNLQGRLWRANRRRQHRSWDLQWSWL